MCGSFDKTIYDVKQNGQSKNAEEPFSSGNKEFFVIYIVFDHVGKQQCAE
jgi:hypothetical protein